MAQAPGIRRSLRQFVAGLPSFVQTRLELAGLDAQEALGRVLAIMAMLIAAGVLLFLALLVATFLLILVFWQTYAVAVALILLLLYGLGGVILLLLARHAYSAMPTPFEDTRRTLQKDAEALHGALSSGRGPT